jgi:hypothetical protein
MGRGRAYRTLSVGCAAPRTSRPGQRIVVPLGGNLYIAHQRAVIRGVVGRGPIVHVGKMAMVHSGLGSFSAVFFYFIGYFQHFGI